MIKVQELKIGNRTIQGIVTQIGELITIKDNNGFDYLHDIELEPIPLTEDVLLKCGFERKDNCNPNFHTYNFNKTSVRFSAYGSREITFNYGLTLVVHIKYLHQLQNIYFALIGEELNVNL